MGEVVALHKEVVQGGELARDIQEKLTWETLEHKFQLERVFVLGKIFPFLLKWEDFWSLVQELAYDRNPELFETHVEQPLLERVADDNSAPVKKAA